MINILRNHRYLLYQMVKKDLKQKYNGSALGKIWVVAVPVIMLAIYTFVFSEIFQTKWNIGSDDKFDFALILFAGLTTFNMISEILNKAVSLIHTNVNYVKKVVFPLEILPLSITVSALINSFISFAILIIAKLVLMHNISKTLYQALLMIIPLFFLGLGLSLLISAISVYFRDMNSIINVLVTIFMYISPVFFPLEAVPEKFRIFCLINPLTYIIENFRNTLLYGLNINWRYYFVSVFMAGFIFLLGKAVFAKAKEGFADVV